MEKIILCLNRFHKICLLPIGASNHDLFTQWSTGTHIHTNTLIHTQKSSFTVTNKIWCQQTNTAQRLELNEAHNLLQQ